MTNHGSRSSSSAAAVRASSAEAGPVARAASSLRRITAVAQRETRSAFTSPTGWIVLMISGIVASAAFFAGAFEESRPATLRTALIAAGWALFATAPALSMRSFSEEFRLKTWETLFASPLSPFEMVLGKALGCFVLIAASLVPISLLVLPLEWYSAPDYGEVACGLLGLLLAGMAATSIGIAVSTTTASQAVAFLGGFFAWFALVVGSRVLVGAVAIEFASTAAALDPLRRLESFTLGLFDSAAVVYFLAITAVALAAATVSIERVRDRAARTRVGRIGARIEPFIFVLACAAAAIAIVALFSLPKLRVELDATKTRSYSLAPATTELLGGLDGDWKVLLFVDAAQADPAVLRQVDEVLERFHDANPAIDARRIDPSDPASSGAFEEALATILATRASDVARCSKTVARALATFDGFRADAVGQPAGLRAAAALLPADAPQRRTVEQVAALFAQIATDGEQFRSRIIELTRTTAARPLPDLEGARSALAEGFRLWSDQLASAASVFGQWRTQPSIPTAVRNVLTARIPVFDDLATQMQSARQELEALPALEFDTLGRDLLSGEAAVVAGGGKLAVVPAWRIFPRRTATSGTDLVSYSFGFRGEEVLSGAIRSIAAGVMPEVVFVHCEATSLLRAKKDHNDFVAVADSLRSAGFSVREWTPGRGEKPRAAEGRPQVFVAVPALARTQLDLSREERLLVTAVETLVSDGESVLLTAGRSMLAVLGQPDPWQSMLSAFGMEADAGRVILELEADAEGTPQTRAWQMIESVPSSAVALRLRGRAILLNQPMRIQLTDPAPAGVKREVAVTVEPSGDRWLADDTRGDGDGVHEVPAHKRFNDSLPVVVLAEREVESETQRVVLVASGGWLLTSVADNSIDLGGGRSALMNPGNRELLLASVAWLGNREDLVNSGLSGREVARIEGLTPIARRVWTIGFSALLALGPIAFGAGVLLRRKGRS
jgi:ABC-2 type transport system permease protein